MSATLPTRITSLGDANAPETIVPRTSISMDFPEEHRRNVERFLRTSEELARLAQANGMTEEILAGILSEE